MDTIMSKLLKKTKTRPQIKPKAKAKAKAKAKSEARKSQGRLTRVSTGFLPLDVEQRKAVISETLELLVVHSPDEDKIEIAEHIHNIGLELVGMTHGINTDNAMVVFLDDDVARLVQVIDQHSAETGLPGDAIVDQLIAQLAVKPAAGFN